MKRIITLLLILLSYRKVEAQQVKDTLVTFDTIVNGRKYIIVIDSALGIYRSYKQPFYYIIPFKKSNKNLLKMELNEIKKALYKEKPMAYRRFIKNADDLEGSIWHYACLLNKEEIFFEVPRKDMGEKVFEREEPAQLLIRWIVNT